MTEEENQTAEEVVKSTEAETEPSEEDKDEDKE